MKILVGCDPEVFVKKDGVFQSAYGLIEGNKKHPQKVNKGAVQVDGMALEFNIDPAASEDEFCINVQEVFKTMCLMVPEHEVVAVPVANFGMDYLRQQPAEALELGCDPDYNAWGGFENPRPDGERPFRTAAGHIHIGWTNDANIRDPEHQAMGNELVKQLDFFLGLPSLLYDNDVQRRSMYGKAGACRYKPYGVEYRTLSNAWLNSEKMIRWAYRATQAGVAALLAGNNLSHMYGDIQDIINNSDVESAKAIIENAGLEVA